MKMCTKIPNQISHFPTDLFWKPHKSPPAGHVLKYIFKVVKDLLPSFFLSSICKNKLW